MQDRKSKARLAALGLTGLVLLLSGCADYLNHRDSITLAAGDAMYTNRGVHVDNPFPPHARNENISGDGKRAATVMEGYQEKAEEPQPPQPLQVILNQQK
jgi:hypothetical protein